MIDLKTLRFAVYERYANNAEVNKSWRILDEAVEKRTGVSIDDFYDEFHDYVGAEADQAFERGFKTALELMKDGDTAVEANTADKTSSGIDGGNLEVSTVNFVGCVHGIYTTSVFQWMDIYGKSVAIRVNKKGNDKQFEQCKTGDIVRVQGNILNIAPDNTLCIDAKKIDRLHKEVLS